METVLLMCMCGLLMILLVGGIFSGGVILGTWIGKRSTRTESAVDSHAGGTRETDEERRMAQEEIKLQEAQHKAFQRMLDYNSDIAYGIGQSDDARSE